MGNQVKILDGPATVIRQLLPMIIVSRVGIFQNLYLV
jgi:hypothetical protein